MQTAGLQFGGETCLLPLSQVQADPQQHRTHFDKEALTELATSIATLGQLEPIIAIRHGEGYQIVAGERRWRACQEAGMETILAKVMPLSPLQVAMVQATENIARKDVTPCEEGAAYQRIISEYLEQHPEADEKTAIAFAGSQTGSSFQRIGVKLRLLELPNEVQEAVHSGALSEGHAQTLTRLVHGNFSEADKTERLAHCKRLCREAVAQGLNFWTLRAKVSAYLGEKAQLSMEDPATRVAAQQVVRNKLAAAVEHLEKVVDLTFDEKKQAIKVNRLTGNELAILEAKLAGAQKYVGQLLEHVRRAKEAV